MSVVLQKLCRFNDNAILFSKYQITKLKKYIHIAFFYLTYDGHCVIIN